MKPNRSIIPYLEVSLAVLFWGPSFIYSKIAVSLVAPVTLVWMRFAIALLIVTAVMFLRGEAAFPGWKELGYFTLLGLIGVTFHQWLQSTALVTSPAGISEWIVTAAPIFMALLGWGLLKEKLAGHQWAGIFLAAAGVLLVASKGNLAGMVSGKSILIGDWLMMTSAVNRAVFSTLSRRVLLKHPAARMSFYVIGTGWLFTSAQFMSGDHFAEILHLSLNGWLAILFLGIFSSGLAYLFWYDALKAIPAAQAGAFLYAEPLIAVVFAALVLSEPLLWTTLAGGAVILSGLLLVNRTAQSPRPARLDKPAHSG